jgi:hypothetical protein
MREIRPSGSEGGGPGPKPGPPTPMQRGVRQLLHAADGAMSVTVKSLSALRDSTTPFR